MAKGKKKGVSSGGPHKKHGPKRHLHRWCGVRKQEFSKAGVLSKYYDYESWALALAARGVKKFEASEFNSFVIMSMEKKKEYFASLKGQR